MSTDDFKEGFKDRTGLTLSTVEEGLSTLEEAIAAANEELGPDGKVWLLDEVTGKLTLLEKGK